MVAKWENGLLTNVAGGGGSWDDGIPAEQAYLGTPGALAMDRYGNLYIADNENLRILKMTSDGRIYYFTSTYGAVPTMATDQAGNVYWYEQDCYCVCMATPDGNTVVLVGLGGQGNSGDGGLAVDASIGNIGGIAVDMGGTVYIADINNNRIRRIDPGGIINNYCGCQWDTCGLAFNRYGQAIALTRSGTVYECDSKNTQSFYAPRNCKAIASKDDTMFVLGESGEIWRYH
jgi:sugar lactone lactonase YvrE